MLLKMALTLPPPSLRDWGRTQDLHGFALSIYIIIYIYYIYMYICIDAYIKYICIYVIRLWISTKHFSVLHHRYLHMFPLLQPITWVGSALKHGSFFLVVSRDIHRKKANHLNKLQNMLIVFFNSVLSFRHQTPTELILLRSSELRVPEMVDPDNFSSGLPEFGWQKPDFFGVGFQTGEQKTLSNKFENLYTC